MKKAKEQKSNNSQVIGAVVALVVMVMVLIGVAANSGKNNDSQKIDYVDACQTEIINKKLVDTSAIDLTYITNFNSKVQETERKNGDKAIYQATWNGKHKDTDKTVFFTCDVSGTKNEDVTIHYATAIMDNVEVFEYGQKGFTSE